MLFFGGKRWIRQAASGKPSTGRFSNPPFRIHFFMRNKKVIFFSEYYLIFGGQRWIRTIVPLREQIYSLPPLATRPSAHLAI